MLTKPDSSASQGLQDFKFHTCSSNAVQEMIGMEFFVLDSETELHFTDEALFKNE